MKQRVVSFSKRFYEIDNYDMDLDTQTRQLNDEGWNIKQVVSTTLSQAVDGGQYHPVLVVTLLLEKES